MIPTDENPVGEDVSRKYTPISHIFTKGRFDLLIKVYYKDSNPLFPQGGLMTQWIDKVEVGSDILIRGPIGRLFYFGNGKFRLGAKKTKPIQWTTKTYKRVGMLCGGTGITPLFQILQAADINRDSIEFSLIFGNRTSKDILLKNELKTLVNNKNFNFNLNFTIDKHEEGWEGLTGYIDKQKILTYMPPADDHTLIMLCGRGKMCKKYLTPLLVELGYKIENIFIF